MSPVADSLHAGRTGFEKIRPKSFKERLPYAGKGAAVPGCEACHCEQSENQQRLDFQH
jgi:hypothetical protein